MTPSQPIQASQIAAKVADFLARIATEFSLSEEDVKNRKLPDLETRAFIQSQPHNTWSAYATELFRKKDPKAKDQPLMKFVEWDQVTETLRYRMDKDDQIQESSLESLRACVEFFCVPLLWFGLTLGPLSFAGSTQPAIGTHTSTRSCSAIFTLRKRKERSSSPCLTATIAVRFQSSLHYIRWFPDDFSDRLPMCPMVSGCPF